MLERIHTLTILRQPLNRTLACWAVITECSLGVGMGSASRLRLPASLLRHSLQWVSAIASLPCFHISWVANTQPAFCTGFATAQPFLVGQTPES